MVLQPYVTQPFTHFINIQQQPQQLQQAHAIHYVTKIRNRFVTEPGTEPAFFLEPQNPPEWPQQFMLAGFSPLASYFSALNADLSQRDPRLSETEMRLRSLGAILRTPRPSELPDVLRRMYRVACVAFQNSFAGLLGSVGSLRKREADEQDFSAAIAFWSLVLVDDRSSATVITMIFPALALSHSLAICSFIAAV